MNEYVDRVVGIIQHNSNFENLIRQIIKDDLEKNDKMKLLFSENQSDQIEIRKYIEQKFDELKLMIDETIYRHEDQYHFIEER